MYSGKRARSFAALSGIADRSDPFLRHVWPSVGNATTTLDVGAGAGRYALALAARAKEVFAVDPSDELLAILRRRARRLGLKNVRSVLGRWEDVDSIECDIAVCNGVMGNVEDAALFFQKLDACARRQVFIGIAPAIDVLRGPLFRHFHGEPLPAYPAYLDAVAVLEELGIQPRVRVVEYASPTYAGLREAVIAHRDLLGLPESHEVDRELQTVLSSWLVRGRDGGLRAPYSTYPWIALSWKPDRPQPARQATPGL
jgi:SAM-dependent methyltransferase